MEPPNDIPDGEAEPFSEGSSPESTLFASGVDDVLEAYLERREAGEDVSLSQVAREMGKDEEAVRKLGPALALLDHAAASHRDPVEELGRVGAYRLIREIGRGGMGVVYEAIQERLGRRVALKLMTPGAGLGRSALERFRREAGVASRLDHSGICTVHDAGEVDGVPFIAMAYLEGETLAAGIRKKQSAERSADAVTLREGRADEPPRPVNAGTSSRQEVLHSVHLIERVARAVHAAHEVRVLHRDLKPANIMVSPRGDPVVLDFGLAGDLSKDVPSLTVTGAVFGTPAYMAPEQVRGDRRADHRADVYALGVTLYECVTLRRPFEALSRDGLYRSILEDRVPDPRRSNPHVPADLCVILATAMERDCDRRYATAEALADDLQRLRERKPIRARPLSRPVRLLRWAQRHPALSGLLLLLAVGLPVVASLVTYAIVTRPQVLLAERETRWLRTEEALGRGMKAMQVERYEEAVAAFDSALELTPSCGEALGAAATALRRLGRSADALALLDRHRPVTVAHRSLRALRDGVADDVGAAAWPAVTDHGETTTLDLFVAVQQEFVGAASRKERGKRAYTLATEAIARSRRSRAFLHHDRIHAAGMSGDLELIERATAAVIALWPERAETWVQVGRARAMGREFERAAAAFAEALAREPRHVEALARRADVLVTLGQLVDAERTAREAVREGPTSELAVMALARALEEAGRSAEALAWHERAVELVPRSAEARYRLGGALLQSGQRGAARGELTAALALDGDHANTLHALAHLERLEGNVEQATAHARRLTDCAETDPRGPAFLGETYLSQGEPERARPYLEEAVSRMPSTFRERWALVHCLVELDDLEAALEHLAELRTRFPDREDVRRREGWVKRKIEG